jgi:hypothetical protein
MNASLDTLVSNLRKTGVDAFPEVKKYLRHSMRNTMREETVITANHDTQNIIQFDVDDDLDDQLDNYFDYRFMPYQTPILTADQEQQV